MSPDEKLWLDIGYVMIFWCSSPGHPRWHRCLQAGQKVVMLRIQTSTLSSNLERCGAIWRVHLGFELLKDCWQEVSRSPKLTRARSSGCTFGCKLRSHLKQRTFSNYMLRQQNPAANGSALTCSNMSSFEPYIGKLQTARCFFISGFEESPGKRFPVPNWMRPELAQPEAGQHCGYHVFSKPLECYGSLQMHKCSIGLCSVYLSIARRAW